MDATTLEQLKTSLGSLKGAYKDTKTRTEALAARWQWATNRYFSLIPFEQERFRLLRGKLLEAQPKQAKNCCAFAFDDKDRLVLVRSIGADGKAQTEQFTAYEGDASLTKVYLQAGKMVGKVVQIIHRGGLPQSMASLGTEGDWLSESYGYSQGRLGSIDVQQFHAGMKKTFSHRYEFAYAADGKCEATRIETDGKRAVVFTADASAYDES